MVKRIIIFLLANFAALGIGGLFTSSGVSSNWYATLAKAPWTPPGWVFGFAWTTIMICYAIYMAFTWQSVSNKKLLIGLYIVQWVLNIIWNPVFFHFHFTTIGLITISCLTSLLLFTFMRYFIWAKWNSLFILPYIIWLVIATSLNLYIVIYN